MKPLLLACFLCSFGYVAHAQGAKPKDNLILIQTPDSAAMALKKLAVAFVAQGYTVDKFDKEFLTLTLAPKALPTPYSPILLAKAAATPGAKSVLRLTGEYKADVMRYHLNGAAEISGSEKGVTTSSFRALEKTALTYPGGQVSYGKQ